MSKGRGTQEPKSTNARESASQQTSPLSVRQPHGNAFAAEQLSKSPTVGPSVDTESWMAPGTDGSTRGTSRPTGSVDLSDGSWNAGYAHTTRPKDTPDGVKPGTTLGLSVDQDLNTKISASNGRYGGSMTFGDRTEVAGNVQLGAVNLGLNVHSQETDHGSINGSGVTVGAYGFEVGHQSQTERWNERPTSQHFSGHQTNGHDVTTMGREDGYATDSMSHVSFLGLAGAHTGSGSSRNDFIETGVVGGEDGATAEQHRRLEERGLENTSLDDLATNQLIVSGSSNTSYDVSGYQALLSRNNSSSHSSRHDQNTFFKGENNSRGSAQSTTSSGTAERSMNGLTLDESSKQKYESSSRNIGFNAKKGSAGELALLEMTKTGMLPGALEYAKAESPYLAMLYLKYVSEIEELEKQHARELSMLPDNALIATYAPMLSQLPDAIEKKTRTLEGMVKMINKAYEPTLKMGASPVDGLTVDYVDRLDASGSKESGGGWSNSRDTKTQRTDFLDQNGKAHVSLAYSDSKYWSHRDNQHTSVRTSSQKGGGLTVDSVQHFEDGHKQLFEDGLSTMPEHLAAMAEDMGFNSVRSKFSLDQETLEQIGAELRTQHRHWAMMSTDVTAYWTEREALAKDWYTFMGSSKSGLLSHYLKVPNPLITKGASPFVTATNHDANAAVIAQLSTVTSQDAFLALPLSMQRTYVATVIHHSAHSKSNPFDAIAAISLMQDDVERAEAYHYLVTTAIASLEGSGHDANDIAVVFADFRGKLSEGSNAAIDETLGVELTSDTLDTYRLLPERELLVKLHLSAPYPEKFLAALRVADERNAAKSYIDQARPDPIKVAKGLYLHGEAAYGASGQLPWILHLAEGTALAKCLQQMSPGGVITKESIESFGNGVDDETKTYAISAQLHTLVDLDVASAAKRDKEFQETLLHSHAETYERNHERWSKLTILLRDLAEDDPEALSLALSDGHITATDLYLTFHDKMIQDTWGQDERWEEFAEMVDRLEGGEAHTGIHTLKNVAGLEDQDIEGFDLELLAYKSFPLLLDAMEQLHENGGPKVIERLFRRHQTSLTILMMGAMKTTNPGTMQKQLDGLFKALRGTKLRMKMTDQKQADKAIEGLVGLKGDGLSHLFTRCFDVMYDQRTGAQVQAMIDRAGPRVTQAKLVDLLEQNKGSERVRGWMKRFASGQQALATYESGQG